MSQGHSATGRIMSLKIPITPSGFEPARAVPQLTAPPYIRVKVTKFVDVTSQK